MGFMGLAGLQLIVICNNERNTPIISMKQISFCITCMNRLKHLQETLEKNILDNLLVDEVEFIVLDYNSQDGLEQWVFLSMMKYIELGILVYYRTDEPVHYLRSHSRNMAFRLANGKIVCNLDADNYLGKGFAEFMLEEFREKDNIFYTSDLSKRDVIGRICLPKLDFMSIRGYNEAFMGYGFEDVELYDRLLGIGMKQCTFSQSEFTKVIVHSNEDRISQEIMFKNIHCLLMNYLNPCLTEVVILYKNGCFGMGVMRDNVTMNCNLCDEPHGIKRCMDERFRITIENWNEGLWNNVENGIMLNIQGKNVFFVKNPKGLYCFGYQYYKIVDVELVIDIVMVLTEALNFLKVKQLAEHSGNINYNGFGLGTVCKNFDYNHKINLM